MNANKHVVVWDPTNEFWEGAIVDQERVGDLETKGAVVLPACPELFARVGFSGFAKRAWGSGWPLDSTVPKASCPLALYYPGEPYRTLRWKARLVGERGEGIPLRLAPMETLANVIRPVIRDLNGQGNAVDVANLPPADALGGWTVGGAAQLSVGSPGMFGLCLYGCARGLRVVWLAATLTP